MEAPRRLRLSELGAPLRALQAFLGFDGRTKGNGSAATAERRRDRGRAAEPDSERGPTPAPGAVSSPQPTHAPGTAPAPEPALHWAVTRDGCRIALYRYERRSGARGAAGRHHPVFLCHGLGSNRFDLDYPGRQSLAKYLWHNGFDTWIVELRGAGRSTQPSLLFGKLRYNWVFDDYIMHDIPAAIARVLELSGRRAVHWVGHSMGGMLAYPVICTMDTQTIRSCVTVGAPSMAVLGGPMHDKVRAIGFLLKFVPFLPYRRAMGLLSYLVPYVRGVVERAAKDFMYNPQNLDDETLQTLMRNAVNDLPASMLLQAFDWYDSKNFRSYYKTFSVRENLHRIEAPLLIVAGSIDRLTPAEDLRFVFDRVSSKDKEFVVVGRETGAATEYGHVDLILGRNAPDDVFPTIASWLDRHDCAR